MLFMENAIITFKDKNSNNTIDIELLYNKETSTIDYDVKLGENYSQNSEMDFIGFLAHMFLQSLQIENKE